jgi:Tetratricopeptide repeat
MDGGAGGPGSAEFQGAQGAQKGNRNTQYNTWNIGVQAVPSPGGAAGPVVAGEIPQEPAAFQPREELAEVLRATGPGVSVVRSVTGMRGVGKTQVAAAYARECADAGWRLVAWVDAGDPAGVPGGLAAVAVRLGIAGPDADAQDAARAVRGWLEADGGMCLVVFDNVTDAGSLRPFLPAAGKARVVITTTGQMAAGPGTVVPVGVFSQGEALAYLAGRTGLADDDGARAVAAEVGWLPLALAQVGAVIAAQRLSYRVYLERLRSVPVGEYLVPGPGEPYSRGVAESVLLSLEAAAADDRGGLRRAVMDVVSLLSPAGVSRPLLHAAGAAGLLPGCGDGAAAGRLVDEALGRLAEGSLLSFSGDGSSVSAHRLVMRVVREAAVRAGTLESLGAGVCGLLGNAAGALGETWQNRAAARDAIGQVTALHRHLAPYLDDYASPLAVELLALRGWALFRLNELGDTPAQAVEHGRALVADRERLLGTDHPGTRGSRNDLAAAYRAAGRTAEAIPLLERTLADFERLLGTDHPSANVVRRNLAALTDRQGAREGY